MTLAPSLLLPPRKRVSQLLNNLLLCDHVGSSLVDALLPCLAQLYTDPEELVKVEPDESLLLFVFSYVVNHTKQKVVIDHDDVQDQNIEKDENPCYLGIRLDPSITFKTNIEVVSQQTLQRLLSTPVKSTPMLNP